MPRRFPPPWIVEEHNNACFIVRDGISISRMSPLCHGLPWCGL
jgi:hypothetical protein